MAGSKARVQVSGAREFRAAMKAMEADLSDLTSVNKAAAQPVLNEARQRVPILTGNLRDSHKLKATRTSARVMAGSGVVPYAGPIHFGWPSHNIEANPWLWESAADKETEVVNEYEKHIEALIRKVDAMTPDR